MVAMVSATHTNSTTRVISPARGLRGSLMLPGDKSISHRYAMLAGFAKGTSRLTNFSTGADPHSSLACMQDLGAQTARVGRTIEVTGTGGQFQQPKGDLDCGNSGSTMRMLAGLVAAQQGTFRFVGDESLTKRPMERIRKPLEQMGARVSLTDGHAPMTIHGGELKAIDFEAPIASAQVKTAVLFAGLQAKGTTSFAESIRTRDHTEHALKAFGAELTRRDDRVYIAGGQELHGIEATVPGDISSAAFFLCAALLFEDSNLVLDALGLNPTRASLLDAITTMGGYIKVLDVQGAARRDDRHDPGEPQSHAERNFDFGCDVGAVDRRVAGDCGDWAVYDGGCADSRCARAACEGVGPDCAGGEESARDGRRGDGARGWA